MKFFDVSKVLRVGISILVFMSLITVVGMKTREAHQFFYMLSVMALFGLVIRNVWVSCFLWWSIFLYVYYRFNIGGVYLQNIFIGCVLYYLTKLSYKKEHINYYINAVLWMVVVNLGYSIFQILGKDFIYADMCGVKGFMGAEAYYGVLIALAIPLVATRRWKLAIPLSLALFYPLCMSRSSTNVLMGGIGFLFALWFKIRNSYYVYRFRNVIIALSIVGVVAGTGLYIRKVDKPDIARFDVWYLAMRDGMVHPVTGWGMDSFRQATKKKQHIYAIKTENKEGKMHIDWWDNPHNLYVSLFFEWGILGWILLLGYLRQCAVWFIRAEKDANTVGIAGVGIVLLLVSFAHFPLFLGRFVVFLIPLGAMLEIQTRE